MKIPAVALAAAFGGGIVLGLQPQIGSHINSRLILMPAILGIASVVCLALALLLRERLVAAGILSLACWVALGVVAVSVAEPPMAADHVLRRIAAGTVELNVPLRWHGKLRSEPARLPWGYGLEIEGAAAANISRRWRIRPPGISGAAEYSFAGDAVCRFPADKNRDGPFDNFFAAG